LSEAAGAAAERHLGERTPLERPGGAGGGIRIAYVDKLLHSVLPSYLLKHLRDELSGALSKSAVRGFVP
jgi:hypothetical protein